MKKCDKCGKENIDEATFCANCGSRLVPASSNKDSNSRSSSKPSSIKSTYNKKVKEEPSKLKVFCCYVPVVLFVIVLVFSMILNAYPENFSTTYEGDFNYLDLNGDGKLSFDEARQLDPYMEDNEIGPYFYEADKNGNGY